MTLRGTNDREILQGAATSLQFQYPDDWDPSNITGIDVSVFNSADGSELISSQPADIYPATSLESAAFYGSTGFVISAGATDLLPGDVIYIGNSDNGPPERTVVRSYDTTTKTVTTVRQLEADHSAGAEVHGCWATYDFDAGDSSFFVGVEYPIQWEPSGGVLPAHEIIKVSLSEVAQSEYWNRMEAFSPQAWLLARERDLDVLEREIREGFASDFLSRGLEYERIKDPRVINNGMLHKGRYMILGSASDTYAHEYTNAKNEWADWLNTVLSQDFWRDNDQDNAVDPDEIGPMHWEPIDRSM